MTRFSQAVPLGEGLSQGTLSGIESPGRSQDDTVCSVVTLWEAHDDLGMGIRFMKGIVMGILLSSPMWVLILWALL